MCLECSAVHRAMGVHMTFVRSVDLDEWTQSQIDAMRLGGNGSARSYFRQMGCSDLGGSKKYKSKAAKSYRAELDKLVQAEAAKRGEGTVGDVNGGETTEGGSNALLDNLKEVDLKKQQEEAKEKLEAARTASSGGKGASGILTPKAQLASQMPGASKLIIKPKGNLGALRKPASTSTNRLKKPMKMSSKLRVNKLSMKLTTPGTKNDADGFEDVEETRKNVKAAEEKEEQLKKEREEQMKNDEALAMAVQEELK